MDVSKDTDKLLTKQESVDEQKKVQTPAATPSIQNQKGAKDNVYSEIPSNKPANNSNPAVTCSVINELSAKQLIKKAGITTDPTPTGAIPDKISPTAVVVSNGKTPNPNPNPNPNAIKRAPSNAQGQPQQVKPQPQQQANQMKQQQQGVKPQAQPQQANQVKPQQANQVKPQQANQVKPQQQTQSQQVKPQQQLTKEQEAMGGGEVKVTVSGGKDKVINVEVKDECSLWSSVWVKLLSFVLFIGCVGSISLLVMVAVKRHQASMQSYDQHVEWEHGGMSGQGQGGVGGGQRYRSLDTNWTCNALRNRDPSAPSGEYDVTMPCGRKFRIFCDMTNKLNGGRAVTFLSREGLTMLGQANYDLGPLLSDKSAVIVRSLLTDGTQNSALLQQLDHLNHLALAIGLNGMEDFTLPHNADTDHLGLPFLFTGFTPGGKTLVGDIAQQGVKVNGQTVVFSNCDDSTAASSYVAAFPKADGLKPAANTKPSTSVANGHVCEQIISGSKMCHKEAMPHTYFMFGEFHFGGCDCYTMTINDGVQGISIGFH